MAIKRPPQHAVDADPRFIDPSDEAWDHDRIKAERKALAEEHRKAKRKGEPPDHPWDRYQGGATRYDLDAPDTIGGTTVTARSYLKPDIKPTVFHLRRIAGKHWSIAAARMTNAVLLGAATQSEEMWRCARLGIVKITEGEGDGPESMWKLDGGEGGQPLSESDMQLLFECSSTLVLRVGTAVFNCSGPLMEAEGKR